MDPNNTNTTTVSAQLPDSGNDQYTNFVQDQKEGQRGDSEILAELGITMPAGVLTEEIVVWNEFFDYMIQGYSNNIFGKKLAQQMYKAFSQTDQSEKKDVLNKLHNLLEESINIKETNLSIYAMEQVEEKINRILGLLSEEDQLEFIKQISDGVISESMQARLALLQEEQISPEQAKDYARYRLSKALDRRNNLDARKFNTPLTTDDIQSIVDESDELGVEPPTTVNLTPQPQIIRPAAPVTRPAPVINEIVEPERQFTPVIQTTNPGSYSFSNSPESETPNNLEEIEQENTIPPIANNIVNFPARKSPTLDDLLGHTKIDQK